jgi:transposase
MSIHELHRKGVSISEIARQTRRDRKTVRKVIVRGMAAAAATPRRRGKWRKLKAHEPYLK